MTQSRAITEEYIEEISPLYATALKKLSHHPIHEKEINSRDEFRKISVTQEEVTLAVLVNPSNHIVTEAGFLGRVSETERGFLEGLCQILENKPILECADHGVIRLEFFLRDPSHPPPVRGIVLPANADKSFAPLEKMVRSLLSQYQKETNYSKKENFFHPSPNQKWRQISKEEKLTCLREAITAFCQESGLKPDAIFLSSFDQPVRVSVGFAENQNKMFEQQILLKLERYLKVKLENTLEIYTEELKDRNGARRL